MARINLQATIDMVDFPEPVWEWLDLYGDMLVGTQEESRAHEGYVADDPFKKLLVLGTNRMIGIVNSIYILLRCECIDLAAAQVRMLCDALITVCFVAKAPKQRAAKFWDYYTIEAFETASEMADLERGRAKPEHVAAVDGWLNDLRPDYDRLKSRYTYVVQRGKDKGKSRSYMNWCNRSVADQAKECGAELDRIYQLVYKQMSAYVHCSAFSLRHQAAYSRVHYDARVVHVDMATLVRTTVVVWIEIAKFLAKHLGWNLMPQAMAMKEAVDRLDAQHFPAGRAVT